MNDYFKDICDWQDEDERWKPTVYQEFDNVFEYNGQSFRFHYKERDWDVLGLTPEENKAMGRMCVIEVNKEDMPMKAENVFPATVCHGKSLADAVAGLKTILNFYFEIKDMTRTEFDAWRQKSKNSGDTA